MLFCKWCIVIVLCLFFFFKQKTAYEMRISDWSSDVCSSDLTNKLNLHGFIRLPQERTHGQKNMTDSLKKVFLAAALTAAGLLAGCAAVGPTNDPFLRGLTWERYIGGDDLARACAVGQPERFRLVYNAVEKVQRRRSEEHTSELQSL